MPYISTLYALEVLYYFTCSEIPTRVCFRFCTQQTNALREVGPFIQVLFAWYSRCQNIINISRRHIKIRDGEIARNTSIRMQKCNDRYFTKMWVNWYTFGKLCYFLFKTYGILCIRIFKNYFKNNQFYDGQNMSIILRRLTNWLLSN